MGEVNNQKNTIQWKRFDNPKYKIIDWIVMFVGSLCCILICLTTLNNPFSMLVWSIVLCFYFFFYRRIVQVIYWSWDTFQFLRRNHIIGKISNRPVNSRVTKNLPIFHFLISSYKASGSIRPVIKAIAGQDYPKDRFHIWIITEHSEQLEKNEQENRLIKKALNINLNNEKDKKILPFLWRCISFEMKSLENWIEQITSGNLQSFLNYPESGSLILEDLFSFLLHISDGEAINLAEKLKTLRFAKREITLIESNLNKLKKRVEYINGDFSRLLGSNKIYDNRDFESQLIRKRIRKMGLKKIGRRLCERFSNPELEVNIPKQDIIEKTAKKMIPSTQEIISETIEELPKINIHHLDPIHRGFKPGALNFAYRKIKADGLIDDPENKYFIIVDSDSLLPSHALKTIAQELNYNDQKHSILQMSSLPTANFFSEGWYSKFLSFTDAIGAVGKWARSTRRQLKPDLHAGSGVVVPVTLSRFIEKITGNPWDESTLTEDARLIIGQFGMMNSVKNKTKMAPIFLLEAVPGEETFWNTYKSFWNQRRRWTTGGYDEFFYMLLSKHWLRNTRFNQFSKKWEIYKPDSLSLIKTRIRQLHRLQLWLWDHFIWGIGGFIALTHWWLISVAVTAPSKTIFWIGLIALLFAPLIFLLISARELSWFIPGGLSKKRMCLLYFQSFVAIWLYCLPVVVTQFFCILGLRSKFIEWKPTKKPRYELSSIIELEE